MVCGSVGCTQGACKRRCFAKKIAVVHEESRIKKIAGQVAYILHTYVILNIIYKIIYYLRLRMGGAV